MEYLGLLVAAALLVVAILSTPLPAVLAREVGRAVCQVTAISGCTVSDPTTTPATPARPAAPAPPIDARHAQQAATNTAAATSDPQPRMADYRHDATKPVTGPRSSVHRL